MTGADTSKGQMTRGEGEPFEAKSRQSSSNSILLKGLKVSFSFAQNPSSLLFPSSARRLMVAKNASFEVTKHKRPHSHSFFKSANLALHCTEVPKSLNPPKYFILSVISRIFQANFERFAFKTCFDCCRPVNFRNF